MIRGQQGYRADKRGHQHITTALKAGHPLAVGMANDIADRRADRLEPATQAAIALTVAAEWGDATSVREYCQKWDVSTEWYTHTNAMTGKSWQRIKIICARAGEATGTYSPNIPLKKAEAVVELIRQANIEANGGRS